MINFRNVNMIIIVLGWMSLCVVVVVFLRDWELREKRRDWEWEGKRKKTKKNDTHLFSETRIRFFNPGPFGPIPLNVMSHFYFYTQSQLIGRMGLRPNIFLLTAFFHSRTLVDAELVEVWAWGTCIPSFFVL